MFLGGGPSAPKPQPQQAAPKEEDKAVQEASAEALRRRKQARGYKSTILNEMASGNAQGQTTFGA